MTVLLELEQPEGPTQELDRVQPEQHERREEMEAWLPQAAAASISLQQLAALRGEASVARVRERHQDNQDTVVIGERCMVVCDGMGGVPGGQVASETVANAFAAAIETAHREGGYVFRGKWRDKRVPLERMNGRQVERMLKEVATQSRQALVKRIDQALDAKETDQDGNEIARNAGTTLVAVVYLSPTKAVVYNRGDSLAYMVTEKDRKRAARLGKLSLQHLDDVASNPDIRQQLSLTDARQYDIKRLSVTHADSNGTLISGFSGDPEDEDRAGAVNIVDRLPVGTMFWLCTDGMMGERRGEVDATGMIDHDTLKRTIVDALYEHGSAAAVAERLLRRPEELVAEGYVNLSNNNEHGQANYGAYRAPFDDRSGAFAVMPGGRLQLASRVARKFAELGRHGRRWIS